MPVNVIPNTTGEGIRHASDQIFQAVLQKKERELKSRQLDIQDQDQAMRNLLAVTPFLPEGASVADQPYLRDLLDRAIPEFKGQDISGLIPNKETLDSFLDTATKEIYRNRGSSDPDFQRLIAARRGLGATTEAERGAATGANIAEAGLRESRAEIYMDSFNQLVRTPELMDNIARSAFGQDPKFSVDLGGGQKISFDSNKAADLWLGLQRLSIDSAQVGVQSRAGDLAAMKLSMEEMKQSREALFGIAEDLGIGLSKENADKIIISYQNSVGAGTDDWNNLWGAYQEAGDSDSLQLMSSLMQSVRVGQENINNVLGQSEAGRSVLTGIALQNALAENLPKDVVAPQTDAILRSLEDAGLSIGLEPGRSGIGGIMGPRIFKLKGSPEARDPETALDLAALRETDPGMAEDVQIAINLLARGQSPESIALGFGSNGQKIVSMAQQLSSKPEGKK